MTKLAKFPDWVSAPHQEWPVAIQVAYLMMAQAARRRMDAEAAPTKHQEPTEGRAA